jgi:hypothetical protein
VNVLSGYEDVSDLTTALTGLTYGGSSSDASFFSDLYATTWSDSMTQEISVETLASLAIHAETGKTVVENSFDPTVSSNLSEAIGHESGGTAYFSFALSSVAAATVYRSIGGELYKETAVSSLTDAFALNEGSWSKADNYLEKTLVVKADGSVTKFSLELRAVSPIGDYQPSDLMDSDQWVIPDRTKLSEDSTVNALSPASRSLADGILVLTQNKYEESKYCFGGIVSAVLTSESGKSVQTLINVASVNKMNDYVVTRWEIRILYYQSDGTSVVSSTPIKVDGDNESGFFVHAFTPAYNHFRLYLVVNGSDIGAQFSEAEIRLNSLKLYSVL